MKKIVFFISVLCLGFLQLPSSVAGVKMIDCSLQEATDFPAVQSFVVLESVKKDGALVSCNDSKGNRYKIAFTGVGIGLEMVRWEGLKLAYVGASSDIPGTYYGLRVAVSALVGANMLLAVGNWGQLSVVGVDVLAGGFDVSLVRLYVGKNWSDVALAITEDLASQEERL
ncbi:MAG: hypothetical protein HYY62_08300 [Deltaproteobacteria bacterium]|nr:hypothetical protein [Deltaproteobacteria bacterium]